MDLVSTSPSNTATTGSGQLVPSPAARSPTVSDDVNGGFTTWRYSLSTGNQSGDPVCGTVTVRESPQNEETVAGVNVDMAAIQKYRDAVRCSNGRSAVRWRMWLRTCGRTSRSRGPGAAARTS